MVVVVAEGGGLAVPLPREGTHSLDRHHAHAVGPGHLTLAAAEQVSVEVPAEGGAHAEECDGIDAGDGVAEGKRNDSERVPERVVVLVGVRVVVEPEHEHVLRQEANREDEHERRDHLGHLLPGPDLATRLARQVLRAQDEMTRHQDVEEPDYDKREGVVDNEFERDHRPRVPRMLVLRERVADLDFLVLVYLERLEEGKDGRGKRENRREDPDESDGDDRVAYLPFGASAGVELAQRIDYREEPVGAERRQREDGHSDADVLGTFRYLQREQSRYIYGKTATRTRQQYLADEHAVRPGFYRVHGRGKWHIRPDDEEVSQREAEQVRVGDVPHVFVLDEYANESAIS